MSPLTDTVVDQGIPLPPPRLRSKVAGTDDAEWFAKSGRMSLEDFSRGLAAIGRSFEEFNDVLDWGCGCGRILRHLPPPSAPKRIYGFDIDQEAIAWVTENLPWVETSRTEGLPPLPYVDASFDLIFNHSVMSHLDAFYQDAWLGELRRTLRPGGIAILTVHGRHVFQKFMETSPPDVRTTYAKILNAEGIIFIKGDQSASGFPDFYHTSFNDVPYVFNHWARFLDIRCYIPQGAMNYQDLVVLQRPVEDDSSSWTYEDYVALQRSDEDCNLAARDRDIAWRDNELAILAAQSRTLQAKCDALQAKNEGLLASTSWRLTKPIRAIGAALRRTRLR
jgi:SAM-dependent methyltransferase